MGSNLALGSKPQNLMHNLRVDRVKSLLSLAAPSMKLFSISAWLAASTGISNVCPSELDTVTWTQQSTGQLPYLRKIDDRAPTISS